MTAGAKMLALLALMAMVASAQAFYEPLDWIKAQASKGGGERDASLMVFLPCGASILFSFYLLWLVSRVKLRGEKGLTSGGVEVDDACWDELETCYKTIQRGAKAFLFAQYRICFAFILLFGVVVVVLCSRVGNRGDDTKDIWDWKVGGLTLAAFAIGAFTSIASGYIGMMVAVYSNARTASSAVVDGPKGWTGAFNTAFRAGAVMGFSLCGLAILILYGITLVYRVAFTEKRADGETYHNYKLIFECTAGFGLGGSCIAMFGRVGGGIFTKAADVGADLSGKVIGVGDGKKLDEDSPYNPAVIADNVGDNVGDVAGMGSDLFGSLGEASCAAMLIGASCPEITTTGWAALVYPLYISSIGALVCLVLHFVATDIWPVRKELDIERVLKIQLLGTSFVMTGVMYPVTVGFLPTMMTIQGVPRTVYAHNVYGCVVFGVWAGCFIGFITEYFTSHSYKPTRDVAKSCETGAATNIIYGLALGYLSSILPVAIIAGTIYFCVKTTGMYGVAIGSLGMLSTLATCLTIDVYGPISDNAGGVAEMSEFPPSVRDKTDALDAAGNTTAAIGKGFAIGSATLVSLALIGAFISRASNQQPPWQQPFAASGINLMSAVTFSFVVFGANIPYWFSALTMKSVGEAANAMVKEVARQWAEIPGLKDSATLTFDERKERRAAGQELVKPDYDRCIKIATNASLREMIAPAALVICTPIIVGSLFGVEAVVGFLSGALSSSVQLAISMSNTGGAWDNAKKYCEKGELNGYFAFNDGTQINAKDFRAGAAAHHGDDCLVVPAGDVEVATPVQKAEVVPPANNTYYYSMAQPQPMLNPYGPGPFPPQPAMYGYGSPVTPPNIAMFPQMYGAGNTMVPPMYVSGGNFGQATPSFKSWLNELSKTNPNLYKRIMMGEEPVMTVDGRKVIYAGKKSMIHAAAVVGDTVGDPLKDTSGPALNIVMKLMAIICVIFADFFMSINGGNGGFWCGDIDLTRRIP